MKEIFIPGNVPSLKNSKIATSRGVFASKTVAKYLRSLGILYYSSGKKIIKEYKDVSRENVFRKCFKDWVKPEEQVVIGYHFVRGSKHKFDFGNACQIIQDLMVAHDFLEDDNMDYLIPMPYKKKGKWYSYNKDNPGVYIKVLTK